MKILVTGAKGFIGKNLIAELRNRKYYDIFECDRDTDPSLLDEYYKDKKDTAELLKTALDSSCHYYNPTAAQSISTAVKF